MAVSMTLLVLHNIVCIFDTPRGVEMIWCFCSKFIIIFNYLILSLFYSWASDVRRWVSQTLCLISIIFCFAIGRIRSRIPQGRQTLKHIRVRAIRTKDKARCYFAFRVLVIFSILFPRVSNYLEENWGCAIYWKCIIIVIFTCPIYLTQRTACTAIMYVYSVWYFCLCHLIWRTDTDIKYLNLSLLVQNTRIEIWFPLSIQVTDFFFLNWNQTTY